MIAWQSALLWVLIPLIVLSALFSGSETAITAASRSRMLRRAQAGSRAAQRTAKLIESRESVVGALLISNNLVNVFASSIATALLLPLAGEAGIIYASLGMTVILVIFAEILPKTWALGRADVAAQALSPLLRPLHWLLGAPARWLIALSQMITRSRGGDSGEQARAAQDAREDILGAIELHHQEGKVGKTDRDMLAAALDLNDTPLADIMLHARSVESLNVALPWDEIIERVIASGHSRLPFWRDSPENIVGVLHVRDLLGAVAHRLNGAAATPNIMTFLRPPWFVPETNTLDAQLAAFRRRRQHFALVVDEYGGLVGLVTLEDILEELVGEIADEHDPDDEDFPQPAADGSRTLEGDRLIRNLNRALGWRLPDDEAAATIAGLVFQQAQEVPAPGATFIVDGYKLEVLESSRKRIVRLRVHPPAAEPDAD